MDKFLQIPEPQTPGLYNEGYADYLTKLMWRSNEIGVEKTQDKPTLL